MANDKCNCKDVTIVEGIFGELFAEGTSKVSLKSSALNQFEMEGLSTGGGDQSAQDAVKIKSYTITNSNRMEVVLISWGATIVSLKCPDKFGKSADIVLGFDDIESYIDPVINRYIGCILGRYCNRIKNGSFTIRGKEYQLSKNDDNKHHLHGGANGFGRQLWDSCVDGCSVVMTYLSDDFEEGYPGALLVTVRFELKFDKLEISMRATTTKPTIVNLSYAPYFNLAGHDAGECELKNHKISLNCDRWTFADFLDPVPSGAIRGVGGTIMDLRIPQLLGNIMFKVPAGQGYDHNLCVLKSCQSGPSFVARALHEKTGRFLEIYSDQPGVQFNTGGRLPPFEEKTDSICSQSRKGSVISKIMVNNRNVEIDSQNDSEEEKISETESEEDKMSLIKNLEFIPGKGGARYKKFCAFSIQPQNYPNAINIPHFPCSVLRPGQVYCNDIIYKFGVQLANYM